MATDPVCKMEVQEAKAAATSEYKGKKYYFCAVGCKRLSTRTLKNTSPRGRIKFTGREKLASSAYPQEKFRKVVWPGGQKFA